MGLDQYLICNSKIVCKEVNAEEPDREWKVSRGIAIQWRKANAIHKWFVDNIQGGNDDCGTYEVSIEDLARLHDICVEVLESTELVDAMVGRKLDEDGEWLPIKRKVKRLADPTVAMELLPTRGGYCFGSQEYGQWYWDDLTLTVESLDRLMENLVPIGWRVAHKDERDWFVKFYYESSW